MGKFLTYLLEKKAVKKQQDVDPQKTLHEFLTAVVITNAKICKLNKLTQDIFDDIKQNFPSILNKLKIDESIKQIYLNEFDNNSDNFSLLVRAISAAQSILSKFSLKSKDILNVYLTGRGWHKDIEIYRQIANDPELNEYGIKEFNSSDIVITTNKFVYGISLKHARNSEELPTLINPSLFKLTDIIPVNAGNNTLTLGKKMKTSVHQWFIDAVKNNLDQFVDLIPNTCWSKIEKNKYKRQLNSMTLKTFVKTFNSILMSEKIISNKVRIKDHTRKIMNKLLSDKENSCFQEIANICTEYSDDIAKALIALLFRPNLGKLKQISNDEIKKIITKLSIVDKNVLPFKFALCTGFQHSVDEKTQTKTKKHKDLIITPGNCETVDEIITLLSKFVPSESSKYKLVQSQKNVSTMAATNTSAKTNNDPAKIFLDLVWDGNLKDNKNYDVVIANLEIRYKGAYTPSPQFQGTMSQQFLKMLHNKL